MIGYLIGAVTLAATIAVLWVKGWRPGFISLHAATGWIIVAATAVMLLGAVLRGTHGGPINPFTGQRKPESEWPGDHFSMTSKRIFFEYTHKICGYSLIPLVITAILSGLYDSDAPRWMWLAAAIILLMSAAAFVVLQARGRCIDTYQAIWGTDPSLPGNKRRFAIGIGVRRHAHDPDGAS